MTTQSKTEKDHTIVEIGDWEPAAIKSFGVPGSWGFVTLKSGATTFLHSDKLKEAGFEGRSHPGDTLEVRVGKRKDDGRSAVGEVRNYVLAPKKQAA